MHPYEIVLQTQLSSVCWNDLFFFLHFLLTIKCQGERMVQQVLSQPGWRGRLTVADYRGLTPLFYSHVNPYGTFRLDMSERIRLEG